MGNSGVSIRVDGAALVRRQTLHVKTAKRAEQQRVSAPKR